MIQFNKPKNLNGAELLSELKSVGIILDIKTQPPFIDGDGAFWLDIDESDYSKAEKVVNAHNGDITPKEPTIADKLASVGLSVDDLKKALGL